MYGKIFGIGGAALFNLLLDCNHDIWTLLLEDWFNSIYDPSAVLAENTN